MKTQIDAYSEFGYYIHRIAMLSDKKGDAMFRKNIGISLRQFLLLRLVEAGQAPMPSQQAIAERLGITKGALSRHIDIARQKGWLRVSVAESSRRQNSLQLTGNGKQLLRRAKKILKQSEQEGFTTIPKKDIEATLKVLQTMLERLEASP